MAVSPPTAAEVCDDIRAAETLSQLAYAYLTAPILVQAEPEVSVAYRYRKECLEACAGEVG